VFSKTITYKDWNGTARNETLYFYISTPEMLDLQFNPMVEGDMDAWVKESIASGDGRKLWIVFKLLVANSYGRRSADGSEFDKDPEWTEKFLNSRQWEAFFEWLLLDAPDGKNAIVFYNEIMPERLRGDNELPAVTPDTTKKKLTELSHEELQKLYLEATSKQKTLET